MDFHSTLSVPEIQRRMAAGAEPMPPSWHVCVDRFFYKDRGKGRFYLVNTGDPTLPIASNLPYPFAGKLIEQERGSCIRGRVLPTMPRRVLIIGRLGLFWVIWLFDVLVPGDLPPEYGFGLGGALISAGAIILLTWVVPGLIHRKPRKMVLEFIAKTLLHRHRYTAPCRHTTGITR